MGENDDWLPQNKLEIKAPNFQYDLEWNRCIPEGVGITVQESIHHQAVQHPDSEAVCSWDGTLTYVQIDTLSSRLASYLIAEGVGPEVIVPLFFEKSKWVIISLLAVLKAGGAFLLLDPSQPLARLEFIVRDQIAAAFALSSSACLDTYKTLVDQIFVVDAAALESLSDPSSSLPVVNIRNAAYYVFTSGSTGTPKGVAIEHAQLATMSRHLGERLHCGRQSRVFQFASYAFDACISDIFPTLFYGGTVCIPSEWERNNAIVDAMNKMAVTSVKITPSLANNLTLEDVLTLKILAPGGESSPASLIQRFASKLRVILLYGPTECCVVCFTSEVKLNKHVPGELGSPVASRAWIVKPDDHHRLAEIGEAGELLIQGPLVGRGYLNDKVKTDKHFVSNLAWMQREDRFSEQCRLYRTGDLVKYVDGETICHVGRIDNQVKIRGQRLELEEVEKKLRDCLAEVKDVDVCHVIVEAVTPSGLTNKQLVAFLCLHTLQPIGALDWQIENGPISQTSPQEQETFKDLTGRMEDYLKAVLPIYAVPSMWIPLNQVPFAVSKKVDRKRLREMSSQMSAKQLSVFTNSNISGSTEASPLTRNELRLRMLWSQILTVPPSSIRPGDNFFSLGGDSLSAMRLVSLARKEGLTTTVNSIFKKPSLRELASSLCENEETTDVPPFSLLRNLDVPDLCRQGAMQCGVCVEDIEDIYPCSTFQLHYVTGYPEFKKDLRSPWNWQCQTVYALPRAFNIDKFQTLWDTAVQRHEQLRTRLINTSSGIYQVVLKSSLSPQLKHTNNLEQYLHQDKSHSMTFGDELLRIVIVESRDSQSLFFVMTIHHIIYDAFARNMLFAELETAYLSSGVFSNPPPRMNQFISYTMTADKTSAISFWTSYLADAVTKPFYTIPEPHKIHHFTFTESTLYLSLPRLDHLPATLPTTLEVAAGLALAHTLSMPDAILCSDRAGRNLPVPGIQDLIGCTTLFLPVRVHVEPAQRVHELLHRARQFQTNAILHEHVGWLELREMENLQPAIKNAVEININPARTAREKGGWGVQFVESHMTWDDPMYIGVDVGSPQGDSVACTFAYDARFVERERVEKLLGNMKRIWEGIVKSGESTTVGEVLGLVGDDGVHGELQSTT